MNILIIGLGSIALKHIAVIKKLDPNANIFALRSSGSTKDHEQVNNIYSLDAMEVVPDFVIISNPTSMHETAIMQSLAFNRPLFIEKPVLGSLKNAERIQKEITERQLLTYVACNMRFHPALTFIKRYLTENDPVINEVNIYCGSYLPDWRSGADFRKVYSSRADMGGGVHLDLIHELDYCAWLFGMPYGIQTSKSNSSSLKISAMDSARFILKYETFTAGITLNYFRRDAKREIEIVAEDSTIRADLFRNKVIDSYSEKVLFEADFNMMDTYYKQMDYFITAARLAKQPMNSFREGVEILKLALHE